MQFALYANVVPTTFNKRCLVDSVGSCVWKVFLDPTCLYSAILATCYKELRGMAWTFYEDVPPLICFKVSRPFRIGMFMSSRIRAIGYFGLVTLLLSKSS